MVTNTRGKVILDDYDVQETRNKSRQTFDGQLGIEKQIEEPTTRRRMSNFYSDDIVGQEEYPATDIAAKLFGNPNENVASVDSVELSDLDLVPSQRTIEYANPNKISTNVYTQEKQKEVVTYTSSLSKTRQKVAAASYVAIVLVLAIAIILTAGSVSGLYVNAASLEEAYATNKVLVDTLATELATVNEAEIIASAESLGYSLANTNNTVTYSVPKMRDTQMFNIESNWFDKLCDGISNILGGK